MKLLETQEKQKQEDYKSNIQAQDTFIQNKKNMLTRKHEAKLESYKNTLMNEYSRKTEQEKNDIINKLNQDVKLVQNNYDQSKNFYEQQKLIAQSEQSITLASSFLEKMKNILEMDFVMEWNLLWEA